MVNLLLLLFHPHPHPRRLLFAPSYTYVPVIMEIQVTLRRQRIFDIPSGIFLAGTGTAPKF